MAGVALRPLNALVEAHRDEIKAVVARHKGKAVAIFGSVARGEEMPNSDVDFLVDLEVDASMFDLIRIEMELERLLPCKIDVISVGGLKPRDHDVRADAAWL